MRVAHPGRDIYHTGAMRRLILLTLLLLALAGGVVANLAQARRHAPPPLPPAPASGHGQRLATLDLAGLTPAQAVEIIGWMQADGVQWLRLRLPWNEIEPQPGHRRWDTLQAAVDAAVDHDMRLVFLLDAAPAWAVKPEDAANPLAPPHDVRDFGRFAEAVAAGYHHAVSAYQIWDEPNIAPHWGAGWADPRGYFTLLREAAHSIRRADPEARIMLAALAPTRGDGAANLSDLAFLEQLYRLGAAEFFDLAAGQAYGFDLPPADAPAGDRLNFRRPELLRQIMAAHSDGDTALWITAWGWWTPPAHDPAADSPWGAVSAAQLGGYVEQARELAALHWPWAGPLGWAEYVITPARDARRAGFALRQPDGALTPAGGHLAGRHPDPDLLGTGAHPAAGRISQGDWRFSPAAADPDQPGSALVIPFAGRAVAVEVQRGFYWATLTAWIDDQPAPLLPRDAQGRAYLSLHDPDNRVALIPLARDLAPGRHELRLQASAGWGQWPLRRVVVDDRPWPAGWPFWPLNLLLALAVGGAGWAWLRQARSVEGRALAARLAAGWDGAVERSAGLAPGWQVPLALALLLAFYLAPGLPLSLAALLPLALLLALRPHLAPVLALVALPFYLRPKLLGPVGLPLHELLIWLGGGWWLLRRLLAVAAGRRPRVAVTALDAALALFLFVGLFATLAAARRGFAFYDFRTVFLTPALFYLLLTRAGRAAGDLPGLPLLAGALLLGAALAAGVGLGQLLSGGAAYAEGVPRVRGLYGSANNLALYLGRVAPLVVALFFLDRSRWRWAALAAGLPIAAAGLFTFSKGLLLVSLPVGWLALALLQPRLRRPAALLILLAGLALLPFWGAERFAGLFDTSGGTTFLRLQVWQSAWRMWLDHPWLGVGPDNFLYAFRSFYVLPTAWEELQLSHPHNLFLDLLTRVGLFGFLAGMWLLLLTLRRGWAQIKEQRAALDLPSVLFLGLFAGLVAGLAHGLIDNSLFLPDLAILTLLVAAAVRRGQAATRGDERR